jgi:hypothetical protein
MAVPWASNLLHFHLNKLFKNVFCILALFGLAAGLATFQNIGRFFSKSSGHPDAKCHVIFVVMLNDVMLNTIILSVFMLNVVAPLSLQAFPAKSNISELDQSLPLSYLEFGSWPYPHILNQARKAC